MSQELKSEDGKMIVKFNCAQCGEEGDTEALQKNSQSKVILARRICDSCADDQEKRNQSEAEELRRAKRMSRWEVVCPPLYRQTDPNHPDINQGILKVVLKWRDEGNGIGIGLYGETGRCKTRMIFLLLKKLHFDGKDVAAIGAKRLGSYFSRSFGDGPEADEARQIVRRCRNAQVLFIDDLGKDKLTDRTEAEFYDLIEHRTSNLLPTHWTANARGAELEEMMGKDRGMAIVRRLREFSQPIEA